MPQSEWLDSNLNIHVLIKFLKRFYLFYLFCYTFNFENLNRFLENWEIPVSFYLLEWSYLHLTRYESSSQLVSINIYSWFLQSQQWFSCDQPCNSLSRCWYYWLELFGEFRDFLPCHFVNTFGELNFWLMVIYHLHCHPTIMIQNISHIYCSLFFCYAKRQTIIKNLTSDHLMLAWYLYPIVPDCDINGYIFQDIQHI